MFVSFEGQVSAQSPKFFVSRLQGWAAAAVRLARFVAAAPRNEGSVALL